MFYFIWLFISSVQDPRPLLALTFDCLLAICPAPLCPFSWNLYLLSLPYIYSYLNPLFSVLCEPTITSISTHLSPTPKELTYTPLPFIPDSALVRLLLFPSFTFVPSYSQERLTFYPFSAKNVTYLRHLSNSLQRSAVSRANKVHSPLQMGNLTCLLWPLFLSSSFKQMQRDAGRKKHRFRSTLWEELTTISLADNSPGQCQWQINSNCSNF